MKVRIMTMAMIVAASAFVLAQQPAGRGAGSGAGRGVRQAPAGGRGAVVAPGTHVLVLGAGSPGISAARSGTSLGVMTNSTMYIFDAGAGIERRLFEARERRNFDIQRIGPIFITHLHSDHTLGLPAALYYVRERNEPFTVFGPPGMRAMMSNILAAFSEDRDMRENGLEHANPVRWATKVTETTGGVVFQDDNVKVTAFEVPHGSWKHALGYRIDTADRSIVISGDTRPSDAVVNACNGCDVLFHEVRMENPNPAAQSGPSGSAGAPSGRGRYVMDPNYMHEFHTSTSELADIATRAHPKLLVLYHQVGRGTPAEFLEKVMAQYHGGPVMYAEDLEVY